MSPETYTLVVTLSTVIMGDQQFLAHEYTQYCLLFSLKSCPFKTIIYSKNYNNLSLNLQNSYFNAIVHISTICLNCYFTRCWRVLTQSNWMKINRHIMQLLKSEIVTIAAIFLFHPFHSDFFLIPRNSGANKAHTIFFSILLCSLEANQEDAIVAWANYTLPFPTQSEDLVTVVPNNSTFFEALTDSRTRVRHAQGA